MREARDIDDPQPGFWLIRLAKKAPEMPARIWCERLPEHADAPIDPWPNSETRILGIFAEIAGKEAEVEAIWHRRGKPITEQEYHYRSAEAGWCRDYAPTEPLANPTAPVRLADAPLPF